MNAITMDVIPSTFDAARDELERFLALRSDVAGRLAAATQSLDAAIAAVPAARLALEDGAAHGEAMGAPRKALAAAQADQDAAEALRAGLARRLAEIDAQAPAVAERGAVALREHAVTGLLLVLDGEYRRARAALLEAAGRFAGAVSVLRDGNTGGTLVAPMVPALGAIAAPVSLMAAEVPNAASIQGVGAVDGPVLVVGPECAELAAMAGLVKRAACIAP